jgi:hypothetical protein
MADLQQLYADLRTRAESYGIRTDEEFQGPDTPGRVEGLAILLNPAYDLRSRCHFLAHALGWIARWSRDPDGCAAVFAELHRAVLAWPRIAGQLERPLAAYRAFEEAASRHAVWLLADLGHAEASAAYTLFARAKVEAVVHGYRHGVAPAWRAFFAEWNRQVARGVRDLDLYKPLPIAPFRPVAIPAEDIAGLASPKA